MNSQQSSPSTRNSPSSISPQASSKRSATPTMLTESEPRPSFRSMPMLSRPPSIAQSSRSLSSSSYSTKRPSNELHSTATMRRITPNTNNNTNNNVVTVTNWSVSDAHVRHIPSFYPLETSSRSIHDSPANIASRISDACRLLSVQAEYNDELATAELLTEDHVEIHVTLWNGDDVVDEQQEEGKAGTNDNNNTTNTSMTNPKPIQTTIIEAQRRKGCAVMYHRYCRNLLDAAAGNFMVPTDDDCQPRQVQFPRLELEQGLPRASSRNVLHGHDNGNDNDHEKEEPPNPAENSLLALEIAASLLSKDRMDARRLGMESLCLLTDPTKTGMDTAILASQLVLFGSVRKDASAGGTTTEEDDAVECIPDELGIREAILSLVQFGRLGEYGDFSDDEEDAASGSVSASVTASASVEEEFNQILHNLALAVLANALEVLELQKSSKTSSSSKPPASLYNNGLGQPMPTQMPCANTFLEESKEMTNRELLSSLLSVLGKAESKPHDACLSAQCLRSLFQASKEAKKKAKELNAKQIVMTALDVGQRTHVKLEKETQNIIRVLERNDTEVEEGRGSGSGTVMEEQQQEEEHDIEEEEEDDHHGDGN